MKMNNNKKNKNSELLWQKFEKRINYKFNNPALLQLALTHRSLSSDSNERLEFLGDVALSLIISDYLYEKYPKAREGVLSRVRARIVSKTSLQKVAADISIRDFIRVGMAENKNMANKSSRTSIVSDAVEAVIGAVYVDGGIESVRPVIVHLFKNELAAIDIKDIHKDYKTQLQEIIQANYHSVPEYKLKSERLLAGNAREFTIQCILPNRKEKFSGKGGSRKEAEQQAALATLKGLYGSLLSVE